MSLRALGPVGERGRRRHTGRWPQLGMRAAGTGAAGTAESIGCATSGGLDPAVASRPQEGGDPELLRAEFEKFKVTYKKLYDGEEEENRFWIFEKNLVRARKWQQEDRGTAVYGVNKFSDMSDEECDKFYLNPLIMSNSSWLQEHDWDPED
ncbi:uncharacterized protein [Narcine bancroftii]|uniref:uncharacterized protein n=1 Tax=Narcine bancroftii TaxID=1343680 RepID=UPI003831F4A3